MKLTKFISKSIGRRIIVSPSILISFGIVTTLFSLSDVAEAVSVNFFDDTFNDSDWTLSSELQSGPNTFTVTPQQLSIGGDPDAYRQLSFTWGNGTGVFVYNLSNFVYDPSTQGAIESIGFSYSVMGSSPASGGVFGDGLLLEQDGSFFVGSFTGVSYNIGWQTKSVPNVPGFPSFDGSILDLSESGSPIRFGYLRTSTQSGGFFTTTNGIDNYSVTVNIQETPNVSEPLTNLSSFTLLSFAALFKKKQSKK
jgi:hypothetical protein